MQGNCAVPQQNVTLADEAKALPISDSQCVIFTPAALLSISSNLWLDNIFVAVQSSAGLGALGAPVISVTTGGKLWATRIAVSGADLGTAAGLTVHQGAKAYIAGMYPSLRFTICSFINTNFRFMNILVPRASSRLIEGDLMSLDSGAQCFEPELSN
jgi:hypothetical protein